MWGGGNVGRSAGEASRVTECVFDFATGTGRIRRGTGGSGDWRSLAEGLITELERILVPYWCCIGAGG